MVNRVFDYINENRIFDNGDSVVLGISGGADSICMLYVLKEISNRMNLTLTAVHVNHHIRGEEADGDMNFVEKVCNKLEVALKIYHIDARLEAEKRGMTEEEAGRTCRYESFYITAEEVKANKIAVAHNLNDNSETILFNLFRGTGIKGLSGIPMKRDIIVRPMLACSRNEIEKYLIEKEIQFRTDRTNFETEYSRNKIRLQLLPYIKQNINEKAEQNIVNAGENLGEIEEYLQLMTEKEFEDVCKIKLNQDGNIVEISDSALRLHSAIFKRIIRKSINIVAGKLKDVTRSHVNSVIKLFEMEVSKYVNLPHNLIAKRTYNGVEIKKNIVDEYNMKEFNIIDNGSIENRFGGIKATIENSSFTCKDIKELLCTKWLDYDRIETLTIRNRREGDYIIVDDRGSKKKLKDYFINEKIPKDDRDKILLLADGSHIVWIIGYRISAYYKVSEETEHILRLEYTKGE